MEHLTTVRELFKETDRFLDTKVRVGGWVRSIRDSKTFGFMVLSDGSFYTTLQVVFHDKMENFAQICRLNVGAAVIVVPAMMDMGGELAGHNRAWLFTMGKQNSKEALEIAPYYDTSNLIQNFKGRLWVECGLIDALGGLSDALAWLHGEIRRRRQEE